jgi:hypothetical protein
MEAQMCAQQQESARLLGDPEAEALGKRCLSMWLDCFRCQNCRFESTACDVDNGRRLDDPRGADAPAEAIASARKSASCATPEKRPEPQVCSHGSPRK